MGSTPIVCTIHGRSTILELKIADGFWYLATPYSKWPGGDLERAAHCASWLAGKCIERGVTVYSPIAHSHPINVATQGLVGFDWLKFDKKFVDLSHGALIALFDGWDESVGVKMEIGWFRDSGKPMYFLDPKDLSFWPFSDDALGR
jgi:uncharacterized protein DUF1937